MSTHDDNWLLAGSMQVTPATAELGAGLRGVVTARPHPTGWFVCARYRRDLSSGDIEDFTEFVKVRTFLLLENGPEKGVWDAAEDGRVWQAVCTASQVRIPEDAGALQ